MLASLGASGGAARVPRGIVLRSPSSSAQRLAVALCCAMLAIDGYDLVAVTFAMPGIGAEWGTSKAMLGALFSIGIIGLAGVCLVLCPLADSTGRRPMALPSLNHLKATLAFFAMAPAFTQPLVGRVFRVDGVADPVSVPFRSTVEF